MKLNKLISEQRKSQRKSQEVFYTGVFKRKSASLFELHNEHFLKLDDLPKLLESSNLTMNEVLAYTDDFETEFDRDLFEYYNLLEKLNVSKSDLPEKKLLLLYKKCLNNRFESLKYMNLYLMFKIQLSSKIEQIIPVDNTDLIEITELFSNKDYYLLYHYKIVVSLSLLFSKSELDFFLEHIFPVRSDSPYPLKEAAALILENMITLAIYKKDYGEANDLLEIYEKHLECFLSYKYRLSYNAYVILLNYLATKNLELLQDLIFHGKVIKLAEGEEMSKTFLNNLQVIFDSTGDSNASQVFGIVETEGNVRKFSSPVNKKID